MKFSILHFLGFIACVSIALALSQFPGHISMLAIVATVIAPTYFMLNIQRWRQITYGGLAGIVLLWLIAFNVTYAIHMHLPRPPIRSGYDTGIPRQQTEFANRIGPFIVPIGFLAGATATLFYATNQRARLLVTNETEMTECPHCGRILSIRSRICPRCETRVKISGISAE